VALVRIAPSTADGASTVRGIVGLSGALVADALYGSSI
jgi:hypothetical protein